MRIHRVFMPDLQAGEVSLQGREARHLSQVLRVSPGTQIRAFNGKGQEAEGLVIAVDAMQVKVQLEPAKASNVEAQVKIHLAVALLKGDKLSDVVRMATELGVASIQPFTSRYGEVPTLSENKLERLRRVAREAAKQCGRSTVPDIHEVVKLAVLELNDLVLVAHPYASARLQECLPQTAERLTLITGPEGGLSEEEISYLEAKGATSIHLGNRILRAETAPIALIAAILIPEAL